MQGTGCVLGRRSWHSAEVLSRNKNHTLSETCILGTFRTAAVLLLLHSRVPPDDLLPENVLLETASSIWVMQRSSDVAYQSQLGSERATCSHASLPPGRAERTASVGTTSAHYSIQRCYPPTPERERDTHSRNFSGLTLVDPALPRDSEYI